MEIGMGVRGSARRGRVAGLLAGLLVSTTGRASPVELVLPDVEALAAAHPCAGPDGGAEPSVGTISFCVERIRVVLTPPTPERPALTSRLEVFERSTGERRLSTTVLGRGALTLVGERLFYWARFELWSVDTTRATAPPVKRSRCDCGTEGSPFGPVMLKDRALCLEEREAELVVADGTSANFEDGGPSCVIPAKAWRREGARRLVETDGLSKTCRRLLGVAKKK
jgi:hypothetical protein